MKTLGSILITIICLFGCTPEPEACCELSKQTYSVGETVTFANCSKNGTEIEWDFGDGNRSTAHSPNHVYTKPGYYTAVLRVYNDAGEDDFTYSIDVGEYIMNSITIDSVGDTVTGPRQFRCDKLFVTHNYDAFARGYGDACTENITHYNINFWDEGAKPIPSQPSLSIIHYYFVLPDTDQWEGNKLIFDTLYADSNVTINLGQQRQYNDLYFYGKGEIIKADLDFGFRVED